MVKRVFALAAHPDDIEFQMAGTLILRGRAGYELHYMNIANGSCGTAELSRTEIIAIRRAEAQAAGDALGAVMHFLDKGDYPLPDNEEMLLELAELMRATAPDVILTHARTDPYNYDHPVAADLTIRARAVAQALGRESGHPPLGAPPVFRFEPHQPEMCEFRPDVLVDITPVFDRKTAAMAAMGSQEHLVRYYSALAERRAVQAVRNGGPRSIRYAEAYQRVFPQVSTVLA